MTHILDVLRRLTDLQRSLEKTYGQGEGEEVEKRKQWDITTKLPEVRSSDNHFSVAKPDEYENEIGSRLRGLFQRIRRER